MSKLDAFILASEKRHAFLVAEIQKSEDYTIRVISEKLEPITKDITKLENDAKWTDRWLAALSVGWGAIAGWLFTTHGGKPQ